MANGPCEYRLPLPLQGTVLEAIIHRTVLRLRGAANRWPLDCIRTTLDRAPRVRSLKRAVAAGAPAVIAEIKKASPSGGTLREQLDPLAVGREYDRAGAAAISVLTEGVHFQGQIEYLAALRWHLEIPLLMKDFVIDRYQVFEARHAGADAVLLIAALLEGPALPRLCEEVQALGMEALVEVHSEGELDRALRAGASLIGVNNRDLRTFRVSLETALRLAPLVPRDVVAVAESGISNGENVRTLWQAGYAGFLIGETLMRSPAPGAALAGLLKAAGGRGKSSA